MPVTTIYELTRVTTTTATCIGKIFTNGTVADALFQGGHEFHGVKEVASKVVQAYLSNKTQRVNIWEGF